MKHIVGATLVGLAIVGMVGIGQESKPSQQELQELFAAQSRPAAEHQRLASMVGDWTFTLRYDAGPGGKGEEQGRLRVYPLMGGRFYAEEARTRFLGQPFEWFGIHGYDTQKKQYVSSWLDNLSTQIDQMTGAWNEATGTLTYTGEEDHPGEGKTRVEWAINAAGNVLRIEMFEGVGAKRRQVMTLTGVRR